MPGWKPNQLLGVREVIDLEESTTATLLNQRNPLALSKYLSLYPR